MGAASEGTPGEWVDALKLHATRVRRIALAWRRGSAPYTPIAGTVVELPEVIAKKKKDDDDETVIGDERTTDADKWARENAKQRWAVAIEYAKKNGPVIDVQLQLWGFDKKKGVFAILKGGAIAKRVNLTGEGAAWMDDGQTTERVLLTLADKLIAALDKKEQRSNEKDQAIAEHYKNIGAVVSGTLSAFQVAMTMREQSAGSNVQAQQVQQNFMIEIAKIRAMEAGVGKAVSEIGPTIREVFSGWTPGGNSPPHQELAKKLLDSITDPQRESWKVAGFDELLADLESALRQIQASESLEAAVATMKAIAPKLIASQDAIGNLFTQAQRNIALQLLDLPGVFQ